MKAQSRMMGMRSEMRGRTREGQCAPDKRRGKMKATAALFSLLLDFLPPPSHQADHCPGNFLFYFPSLFFFWLDRRRGRGRKIREREKEDMKVTRAAKLMATLALKTRIVKKEEEETAERMKEWGDETVQRQRHCNDLFLFFCPFIINNDNFKK